MNTVYKDWRRAILTMGASLQDAIRNLDEVAIKIVLIVNDRGVLEGTISDGDVRRGLLRGLDLSSSVSEIVHRGALVVPPAMNRDLVMELMMANQVQQIPIVDEKQNVVGLHLWETITTPPQRSNTMVVMAGGKGTRLRPITENCPKPMVPLAGKPMLEHIIERAKLEGFNHFVLAIHYLGYMIEDHFGDGSGFGISIEYLREEEPLGTAGALSLMAKAPDAPFVVTNGDVLTDIRYGEVLDFHIHHQALATMAVRVHEWQHPFGVVRTNGIEITGFEEKPVSRSHINAGIYVLSPQALAYLDVGAPCDMPTLFDRVHSAGQRAVAYPMHEPWLDVGRPDDLKSASDVVGSAE